ncbi:MAG: class I SAM-dependent methyltransferase [Pararobbsia sp.]
MEHHALVADQFGATASAYLTSAVHASGADLATLAAEVGAAVGSSPGSEGGGRVLDLGCGAGHASFAVAPRVREVVAYDIAQPMLDVVAAAARERRLPNVTTRLGPVETLPFDDASFDWAISRMSAHHWRDVPAALAEMRRVLKPSGRVLLIDIAGPDHPLHDTPIQAIELLRDASHIRDYRADEWLAFFRKAGFAHVSVRERWRLPIDFAAWIARMRTQPLQVEAIRAIWAAAPDEVRTYFNVQGDGSFELDALMLDAYF